MSDQKDCKETQKHEEATGSGQLNNENVKGAAWWLDVSFTKHDDNILRDTFPCARIRLENIAVTAFSKLFERKPEVFSLFIKKSKLPSNIAELNYSWETKQHGLRVLCSVEKCLNRLEKPEHFGKVVFELAKRHVAYGAKPLHILALMGCLQEAMIDEIKMIGQKSWVSKYSFEEVTLAWKRFFRAVALAFTGQMLEIQETCPEYDEAEPLRKSALAGVNDTQLRHSNVRSDSTEQLQGVKKRVIKAVRSWLF